jgi:hypothetical protein
MPSEPSTFSSLQHRDRCAGEFEDAGENGHTAIDFAADILQVAQIGVSPELVRAGIVGGKDVGNPAVRVF